MAGTVEWTWFSLLILGWLGSTLQDTFQCIKSGEQCKKCIPGRNCVAGLDFHSDKVFCNLICKASIESKFQCTHRRRRCSECNEPGTSDFNECLQQFFFDDFDTCQRQSICGSPDGLFCDTDIGECKFCSERPTACATAKFITRNECEQICSKTPTCSGANERHRRCKSCEKSCQALICPSTECEEGCVCEDSFVRDTRTGDCIRPDDCPVTTTTTEKTTTAVATTTTVPSCADPNERFMECKTCEPTCAKPRCTSSGICVVGCICDLAFLRDMDANKCVTKRKCPRRLYTCIDGQCFECGQPPLTPCGRQLFPTYDDCRRFCRNVITMSQAVITTTTTTTTTTTQPVPMWACTKGSCIFCRRPELPSCGSQQFLLERECLRECRPPTTKPPTTTTATTTPVSTTETVTSDFWGCFDGKCGPCHEKEPPTCDSGDGTFLSRTSCDMDCKAQSGRKKRYCDGGTKCIECEDAACGGRDKSDLFDDGLACFKSGCKQELFLACNIDIGQCLPCGDRAGIACPDNMTIFKENLGQECTFECRKLFLQGGSSS